MTSGASQERSDHSKESHKRIHFLPRRSMMWLRSCCCCYCCCRGCGLDREEKAATSLDDSSSLIGQEEHASNASHGPAASQEHAFYVPRRHSSFLPSTYNSTFVQSERPHSDCSSSSDEEGVPPEQRGRCWSTVPALEHTTFTDTRRALGHAARNRITADLTEPPSNCLSFDKHVLSEIAEVEQGGSEEVPPSRHAPRVDAEIYGHLTFTTQYEKQEQRLTVYLKQAEGLPRKGDNDQPYGTFVKMSLTSSGNGHFRISRTIKKTLDPVYSEEHVFQTNRSKWKSSSRAAVYLRLSVIDCERQGRHDAIGHALLPLDEIGTEKEEHRLPLTPMSLPVQNLGQVLVGLLYTPTQSRLTIHVIKARHLRLDADVHKRHLRPLNRDLIDSFCKVTLNCGGQKVKTCRSRPATGTDPFFDFKCSFVVPPQYLRDASTVVSVVARSTLGRQGATMGRAAVLGPYVEKADGSATQWGRMVLEGRSIVQWRNIYL